ncbi:MAG: MBL fold metallo-hydrolase [Solirubrobacterales bacterium]|nr:MBL fold metallo-hydrolase [Solirubrobacterales bacterium]
MDLRAFTVGPLQENAYLVRADDNAARALLVDPGDEAPRLLAAIDDLGVELDAILLTHTHFDHVGAVAAVARATGARVWCPAGEVEVLADLDAHVGWPEFGPFESYDADETVAGGEELELAGLVLDVVATPGHSRGHVTYAVRDEAALLSGDVLFRGSIGRTDLPGGDGATLMRSIAILTERFAPESVVLPGHGPATTLGHELATNPFLAAAVS